MNKNIILLRCKRNIEEYIKNNIYNYILIILVFIIGIVAGVVVVNNFSNDKKEIINNYISAFFENFNNVNDFNQNKLLLNAILNDLILTIILWVAGTTIVGMPIVLGIIIYRGFCLSYTISSITLVIGCYKSILFCFITLFLPNLLFIPAILTIAVSSLKLYKSIIYEKNKEIVKNRLLGHFVITIIMFEILIVANVVENIISVYLLQILKKYIM